MHKGKRHPRGQGPRTRIPSRAASTRRMAYDIALVRQLGVALADDKGHVAVYLHDRTLPSLWALLLRIADHVGGADAFTLYVNSATVPVARKYMYACAAECAEAAAAGRLVFVRDGALDADTRVSKNADDDMFYATTPRRTRSDRRGRPRENPRSAIAAVANARVARDHAFAAHGSLHKLCVPLRAFAPAGVDSFVYNICDDGGDACKDVVVTFAMRFARTDMPDGVLSPISAAATACARRGRNMRTVMHARVTPAEVIASTDVAAATLEVHCMTGGRDGVATVTAQDLGAGGNTTSVKCHQPADVLPLHSWLAARVFEAADDPSGDIDIHATAFREEWDAVIKHIIPPDAASGTARIHDEARVAAAVKAIMNAAAVVNGGGDYVDDCAFIAVYFRAVYTA